MGVVVKQVKFVARISLTAIFFSASPFFANAANATDGIHCRKTSAAKHLPITVSRPSSILNGSPTFVLQTNCGNIVISGIGKSAPLAVTAIATLSNAGFFNNSLCHRLTTEGIWVLQCGDPTFSGGYQLPWYYPNENLPAGVNNNYPAGTVAMAHRPHDTNQPAQNGSQFFLVYKDTTLPPDYTIWGTITQGLDIVKYVASQGVADGSGDGKPKQRIAIQSVSVK
jgi:peptidyl-prolyl cis-trans isomerase B (cyclophilin B)